MIAMTDHYYYVLELAAGASLEEIKESYRRLANRYHPDKNNDPRAGEVFQRICHAYQQLTQRKKGADRSHYEVQQCRRQYRQTPSHRRFNWQFSSEYIGTQVSYEV